MRVLRRVLAGLLLSSLALGGLPPTTSRNSTDTNNVTTFNFQFPNFTGTHTGTTFSLGVNGISGGGTNSAAALTNGFLMQSLGGAIVESPLLEADVAAAVAAVISGTPNTFAAFDGSGLLGSAPGWTVDSTGQAQAFLTSTGSTSATGLQLGATISSPLSGGYEGVIVGSQFSSSLTFQSSFNSQNVYNSGASLSGGIEQYQDQSIVNAGSALQNYTSYNAGPQFSGPISNGVNIFSVDSNADAALGGFTAFSDSSNFNSGGSISGDYHFLNSIPQFHSGFTLRSFTGLDINPLITDPVTDDASGARISMQNIVGGTSVTGLSINMTGSVDSNPQGVRAISATGRLDTNANNDLVSSQGFQIGNRIESLLHISSGSPVTGTDSLGNNFAGDLEAEDNLANGPIGIGWNSVGFIASVAVASGKTIDKASVFLPAMSLPDPGFTTGGTISDLAFLRVYAPLAQGGTASFGNVYGLQVNPQFGNLPGTTGNWGVWVGDTNADNWFSKDVVIGGSTGKPAASTALDVTGNSLLDGTVTIPPFSAAGVVTNDATGLLASVAPGTSGNVLTSTGTAWISSAPTGGSGNGIWDPVDVVATTNQALTGAVPLVIDGVTLTSPMRVLLAGQTAAADNGVYAYTDNGTTYTLARAADASTSGQYVNGKLVNVTSGTVNANSLWELETPNPIVLGTTALSFVVTTTKSIVLIAGGDFSLPYTVNTPLNFDTPVVDTASGYNATTGEYTFPTTGIYRVSGSAGGNFANNAGVYFYLNGVQVNGGYGVTIAGGVGTVSTLLINATAGDTIDLRVGTGASISSSIYNNLSIELVEAGSGSGSSLLYTIDGPNSSTIQGEVGINLAAGLYSFAGGSGTSASGDQSYASGIGATASGTASHAEGTASASGIASHAEGNGNASGTRSHAEGSGSATMIHSHAEGDSTHADGVASHAEGRGATGKGATSDYDHSEGDRTLASGGASHAEGTLVIASGASSHAGGLASESSGAYSFTHGQGTTSQAYSSVAIGQFNILQGTPTSVVAGDDAFVIGNGPSLGLESNAFSVSNDGTVKTYGHIRSNQVTPPTVAVTANAGTGGSASIANATDTAGVITINTGTLGVSTGDYADITFNAAYAVAPICVLTPANSTISTSVYVTSSTTGFSVNFALAGGISSTYVLNYHCIETQ